MGAKPKHRPRRAELGRRSFLVLGNVGFRLIRRHPTPKPENPKAALALNLAVIVWGTEKDALIFPSNLLTMTPKTLWFFSQAPILGFRDFGASGLEP